MCRYLKRNNRQPNKSIIFLRIPPPPFLKDPLVAVAAARQPLLILCRPPRKQFLGGGFLAERPLVKPQLQQELVCRTNPDLPAQVAVLLGTDAKAAEVAHDVAMHVAAYSPLYLDRDSVPAEVVDKERAIAEETTRAEGKPEKAIPRIVEGRLGGYFKENCLVDQAFAKDPKTTVGKVMNATGGRITGFIRLRVGV